MRFVPRWTDCTAAVAVLLLLGACAPRPEAPAGPAPDAPALPRDEPEVHVGVLVDTASVELASSTGLELQSASRRERERLDAAVRLTVTAGPDGALRISGAGTTRMIQGPLVVRPLGGGGFSIGGKSYRGRAIIRAAGPQQVTAVNVVDLENYLLGVVPHEIGKVGSDLLEAAKAQAVAARTYAVSHRGRRAEKGFDFYATVQDQVYGGSGSEHDVTSRAVLETAGEVLLYDGIPIEAFYHSTCAGRTAAIDEVWNDRPRPYLVSVVDVNPATGEAFDDFSSRFRWTERWTADELTRIFARTLADSLPAGVDSIGTLLDLRVLERTPSDRVRALRIRTTTAEFTVGGDRVRWIFRTPKGALLNSSKFDLEMTRDPAGRITEVVARGGGWGHGIGMCQVGAMGRARAGQDYRTILQTYYPGTTLRDLY